MMFEHSPSLYQTNGNSAQLASELNHQESEFIALNYAEWRAQGITNRAIAKNYMVTMKHLKKHMKQHGVKWIA
ncbi:hypothetical protein J3998_12055 [Thiomicrorhabdus sp. 6S2-11]|uniref:DNA binding HTH domain-containing protein n=1 Tax=Thiomicrorhabdus marina TaxID=2818442 RepID=A0ABS3Q7L4_9GAMM|nr:hypothetical protein [Thiomicrorhabdus marina]MBO1928307.1 hypothetical protein [Thiomicrorhabdus marina]